MQDSDAVMQAYITVAQEAEIAFIIQKSRFIGRCFPVQDEAQAQALLERIRKQHWDATHNCFAYSIGVQGGIMRYSDDGEPGGTAGLPMMSVLQHQGVTDVLVVATRYFGGILLGAGGLVRAYTRTASEAIEAAGRIRMEPCAVYAMEIEYTRWGVMEAVLRGYGELHIDYGEIVRVETPVRRAEEAAFVKTVFERSDGRVLPKKTGECYGSFPLKG